MSEKPSTSAKKISEKTASASPCSSAGSRPDTATVKGTVAQRGMAKKGPMDRYSAQVKK